MFSSRVQQHALHELQYTMISYTHTLPATDRSLSGFRSSGPVSPRDETRSDVAGLQTPPSNPTRSEPSLHPSPPAISMKTPSQGVTRTATAAQASHPPEGLCPGPALSWSASASLKQRILTTSTDPFRVFLFFSFFLPGADDPERRRGKYRCICLRSPGGFPPVARDANRNAGREEERKAPCVLPSRTRSESTGQWKRRRFRRRQIQIDALRRRRGHAVGSPLPQASATAPRFSKAPSQLPSLFRVQKFRYVQILKKGSLNALTLKLC